MSASPGLKIGLKAAMLKKELLTNRTSPKASVTMPNKLVKLPQNIQELEENRKFVADMFQLMESYLDKFLITKDMKESFENCKWNILGSYDADISHEKNMQRIESWQKLTVHVRAN